MCLTCHSWHVPDLLHATPTPPRAACPVLQGHGRLRGYVRSHFDHHLKMVEKGLISPYDA